MWKLFFSKFFAIAALTLSVLNIGIAEHNFKLQELLQNLTLHWAEVTRWLLSFLDTLQVFEHWEYDDVEKDMTAAHIFAISPAMYYASKIHIRLSICFVLYIIVYALIFGSSTGTDPNPGGLQGLYRLFGMLVFISFAIWFLSDRYRERGDVTARDVAIIILRTWKNAAAVFLIVVTLSFAGLVSVSRTIL